MFDTFEELRFHHLTNLRYFLSAKAKQLLIMKKTKIANFNEEIPIHFLQTASHEIISRLKPFFNISRVFGIPSFNFFENIISKSSLCSLLNAWNLLLLTNQIFLLVNRVAKGEDFIRVSAPEIIMRLHVIFVHLWSLIYSIKFASVLRSASQLESRLKIYKELEFMISLRRKCFLLIALFVCIGIALTIKSFIIDLILGGDGSNNIVEVWEKYSETNCGLPPGLLFHSSITSSYCLLSNLVTNFVWIFPEFLLSLLSICLSEFYKRLNIGVRNMEPGRFASYEIDMIREHHGIISRMVADFDDAISFLNLINVGFNTAYIISGFYSLFVVKPKASMDLMKQQFKLYFKLGVAILKLIMSLVLASMVHRNAHESLSVVRSWPMSREFQDLTISSNRIGIIQSFLSQLTTNPAIGFTISKLVTITPRLLLVIPLALATFFVFTRITTSACARRTSSNN